MIEHDRLVNKLVSMALDDNVACPLYCLKARHGLLDNQVINVIENKVAITFQLPDAMKQERALTPRFDVGEPGSLTARLPAPAHRLLKLLGRLPRSIIIATTR